MARPDPRLARQEVTEARIAAQPLPRGKPWAEAIRIRALERLRAMGGLPARRDEYWKYTEPALLNTVAPAMAAFDTPEETAFEAIDRLRIVFTDGVLDVAASDDLTGAGLEIEGLAQALSHDIHWTRDLYSRLETEGQDPVVRPFAALNTALANDGVTIRVTAAARPVHLIYRRTAEAAEAMLRHCVRVEAGADLTLLESGTAAARVNTVLEVDLAEGARFHHVRVQGRDHGRTGATHVFARVGEGALFKTFTLGMNGRLMRNEVVVDIAGADSVAHVAGAAVGDGKDFVHDDTVFITHGAPGCESRQVFKKVLKNGATGVFQGKILVKQVAQKTDGYQISQSLLLDGDSNFLAKPELEIYADDVKCSHGSTSGAIDEEALFYLRSRGVPRNQAEVLLVLSFLAAAVQEIEDEAVQADILARLEGWLIRHRH